MGQDGFGLECGWLLKSATDVGESVPVQRAYTFQQLAASDLPYGQRLIDESEGGHSVDDEYLRASTGALALSF